MLLLDFSYLDCAYEILHKITNFIDFISSEIPAGFGQGSTAPSNTHVLIEGIAEISCNPTGSPKPSVRWRNLRTNSEVVSQGRFTILPNGNLRIKRVMKTDHGKYQCIVRNALGSASKEAELFVRG